MKDTITKLLVIAISVGVILTILGTNLTAKTEKLGDNVGTTIETIEIKK